MFPLSNHLATGREILTRSTVSAKFNRTRVQTAPVTLLRIVQPREWCHWKELGILLQKHPLHVKIDHFRPEEIEFKDKKLKLKMYVFRTGKKHFDF